MSTNGLGQAELPGMQRELAEQGRGRAWVPPVRPTADLELEACFVRAASAWARWRERRRWGVPATA